MNKLFLISVMFSVFVLVRTSYAEGTKKILLKEIRRETNQKKQEVRVTTKGFIEQAKNAIKEKIKKQLKGELITINGNTLSVQKDNKSFTVLVSDKTELRRKFGAQSTLNEFSAKDTLIVIGNRTKNSDGTFSSTSIDATYIRNMSIQRRFAVFAGEVTSKTTSTLTIKTIARGNQTIYISSNTEYKERNKKIAFADISVGDKVIVKGELWDRVNEKIDAKTIQKISSKAKMPPISPTIKITPEKE